ncbi:MAG: hypothetical protein IJS09_00535 [Treponema sp.]|nr:hypothetical protein [Treponema sp.]
MKRFTALLCVLFFTCTFAFTESEDDVNEPEDTEIEAPDFKWNQPGDQYIAIGLMVTFPLNFGGSFPLYRDGSLITGGAGSLGYHRFLTSWFAVGADISFGYHPTIGSNIFTYIPLVVNMTIQPSFKRFEFPITVGVGAALENYLSRSYFPGFIFSASAGVFFRATASWSFGIADDFMLMPQWYSDSSNNYCGVFDSIKLSARYHF